MRKKSPSKLAKNFVSQVLGVSQNKKLLQRIYLTIMSREDGTSERLTLETLDLPPRVFTCDSTLLSCVGASGVPVANIRTIKTRLPDITEEDWQSLELLLRANVAIIEMLVKCCEFSLATRIIRRIATFR